MGVDGALVLVVGPSGAGKDTVIGLARARLRGEPRYAFPRRLVTRPPSPDEDNDEIAAAEFARLRAAGRFALAWEAHGLGYAVPAEAADLARAGRVVVCNVSRRVVEEARARLPRVSVVAVTAAPAIRARRLATRGRAGEGDLATRLASAPPVAADLVIVNDGPPEAAAAVFAAHLRGP